MFFFFLKNIAYKYIVDYFATNNTKETSLMT